MIKSCDWAVCCVRLKIMPYPVLPPTPPPIIQLQPQGESVPLVPVDGSVYPALPAPEFSSTAQSLRQPLEVGINHSNPKPERSHTLRIKLPAAIIPAANTGSTEAAEATEVSQESVSPPAPLLPSLEEALPLPGQLLPQVPALPNDALPDPAQLDETLPDGVLPDGVVPDGAIPDGVLPDVVIPDGVLPDNVLPDNIEQQLPSEIPRSPLPSPPPATPAPSIPAVPSQPVPGAENVIELNADRQTYDERDQVYRAQGNATMRFRGAILSADRIQVNVPNRIVVAEGNAVLTRGQQVIKGDRLVYNLVQGEGTFLGASGELDLGAAESDFSPALPTDNAAQRVATQTIGDRVTAAQPVQVTGANPGVTFGLTAGNNRNNPTSGTTGEVRRLRFEAEQIDFTTEGWQASNVRITNDPFSPPELELRSNRVTFTRLSPTRSEIRARRPVAVFDQGLRLPLLRNRIILDSSEREPGLLQFGFDQNERGGFFIERTFQIVASPLVNFSVTPQALLQRSFDQGNFFDPSSFGLTSRLNATLGRNTSIVGNAVFTSLDFQDIENSLRASLRARQRIGNHTLSLEYTYRDRLFNGSLGFQDVQSSIGFVITSPIYTLGSTGINLSYQGGIQYINANTDRPALLAVSRENNRVDLTRYQASTSLSRPFTLWQGTALPPTPTEGLRYSPVPITPYLAIAPGITGVFSGYSDNETQASLTGSIGLYGQFGHFSRPTFDYTAFNISYSNRLLSGESPFLFDRIVDERILSVGITQQIYGPFRVGIQTALNLDTGREIDTTYSLEYKRRAYSLSFSFSPVREAGAVSLQISDFNWTGDPGRFSGLGADTVDGGVRTRN